MDFQLGEKLQGILSLPDRVVEGSYVLTLHHIGQELLSIDLPIGAPGSRTPEHLVAELQPHIPRTTQQVMQGSRMQVVLAHKSVRFGSRTHLKNKVDFEVILVGNYVTLV